MGVSVVFEGGSDAIAVSPGEETVRTVRLENTGMVVDRIVLDVLGDAAEWIQVEPPQVNLLPGAAERVQVRFKPPRVATLKPGEVPFGLRAMSIEDPEGSRIEEGLLQVGDFGDLSAQLVPKSATGRRSARFRLVVENRGNRPEPVRVETFDPEVKLNFRTRPSVFVAAPGTATFVRVKTAPRKTFFRGPNRTLPFEVTALPEQGEPAHETGVMLEKQTLPEWLFPVLGIAALACGLLLVLWFTVLRPVVHSAATASDSALSAAAQASKAAGAANAAANNAAGAKPNALTALTVKAAAPAILAGSTGKVTVSGTSANGVNSNPKVVWTSSNPAIATVAQDGTVTAVSPGTATITATSGSASPSDSASPSASTGSGPASFVGPASVNLTDVTQSPSPGAANPSVVSGSVTINVVGKVAVSTVSLPQAVLGKPYTESLSGTGGTGAFTWALSKGSLPPGYSLSPDGVLSGTATAIGTATFTVQMVNAGPPYQSTEKAFTFSIIDAPEVGTSSLPDGTIGVPYKKQLDAVFGTPPFLWGMVPGAGSLPNGLNFDMATGTISGTPTAIGTFSFTVQVTDSAAQPQSATQQLTIVVSNQLKIITPGTLPIEGVRNTPYSLTLGAAGGTTPYTWSLAKDPKNPNGPTPPLPLGLTLNSATGVISGTPTVTASTPFFVQVVSAGQPNAPQTLAATLTVVDAPVVSTSSLPDAITNSTTLYSQKLTAVGGTPGFTWKLVDGQGTPPAGLTLNADGTITGTATTAGTSSFVVQATDTTTPKQTATQHLTIRVADPLVVTTPQALPIEAIRNAPFSITPATTGGTAPFTWAVTKGALPTGMTLNPATGAISGTPTTAGFFPITFSLTDSGAGTQGPQVVTPEFDLTVVIAPSVATSSLPDATTGADYTNVKLAAANGTQGFTWAPVAGQGDLPDGLTLNSDGTITGQPKTAGTYAFTVQVTDSTTPKQTATQHLSIRVADKLTITTAQKLPVEAVKNAPYSLTLGTTGGTAPLKWSITKGSLPTGLTLNATSGLISGTPTTAGSFPIITTLTDSGSPAQILTQQEFDLTVVVAPSVATSSLPDATTGADYTNVKLKAANGTQGFTWAPVAGQGDLPDGLTLNSDGTITGAPTTAGTFAFTVQVTDSTTPQQSATQRLSIAVADPVSISTLSLPVGVVNAQYTRTLSASGGAAPYTWSIAKDSPNPLPAGLTLDPATGVIGGIPTKAGASTFNVVATDSGNPHRVSAEQQLKLTVVTGLVGTTSSLPQAAVGQTTPAYKAQLTAIGGTPISSTQAYVWTPTGTLPSGLSLDSATGIISGTPDPGSTGVYQFSVQVTDGSSPPLNTSMSLSITVIGSLKITTATLPDALSGQSYSQTLTATGGVAPYTWSLDKKSPALPVGLTLDPNTGTIAGTTVASFPSTLLTFDVTDTGPPVQNATQGISLAVSSPLAFSAPQIPVAVAGQPYDVKPTPSGGSGNYAWDETGALPKGLTFSKTTGEIGVALDADAQPGTYQIKVTLADTSGGVPALITPITITVNAPLTVTGSFNWSGAFGKAFSQTITPTGGVLPYSFAFASTTPAPSWLTVGATTGVVAGTPDVDCSTAASTTSGTTTTSVCTPGAVNVTVNVKDALGHTKAAQVALTLTIPNLVLTNVPAATSPIPQSASTLVDIAAVTPKGGYDTSAGVKYTYTASGLPCTDATHTVCDTIDPGTGEIKGGITQFEHTGTFNVTVTVTQSDPTEPGSPNTFVASYSLTIIVVS